MTTRERIGGASAPSSNCAERSAFRRRALCVLTLIALAEMGSAYAACVPAGTPHGDTIVCSGTQTEGVAAGSGDDSISILPGASISVADPRYATAVDAGAGNDSVVNEGRISVTVTPPALAPAAASASCSAYWNDPYGASTVRGIGILGGSGNDRISNSGSITVGASSDASSPQATAKGIAGGNGDDLIVNTGTISVAASATVTPSTQTEATVSPLSKGSQGSKPLDISEAASVSAVGIEGGNGKDNIGNAGTLNVNATVSMKDHTPDLTLTGGGNVVATTTLETRAVGIDAGTGKDRISNSGTIGVNATSKIDDVSVNLSLIDISKADTSTVIRSSATGIDAGTGNDDITIANGGSIAANATSTSSSVAVTVTAADASTADTKVQIGSTAVGVVGGQRKNEVENSGTIGASATSQLSAVDVGVNFVDATIARAPGNSSTTLDADAIGIDGRKGANDINVTATGSVNAAATSTAHSTGVGVGFLGISNDVVTLAENGGIADVGITSNSAATGIAGGSQKDYVTNQGGVTATATSTATQVEVGVGIGLVDVLIPIPDLGLVGAGTKADARTTGVDAGAGDDTIFNSGLVKADATANASTTGVSFSLSVFSVGPQLIPVSAGLTAADVATTASAETVGIAGGSGDDSIRNTGQVQTQATANGGAVGVAVTANIEYEKGESSFGLDVTAARAVTESTAKAVGIDGGSGRNELQNDGSVTAGATANGTAIGVTLGVAGNLRGAAGLLEGSATDTSSTASAEATGVRGGADADQIRNSGSIATTATGNVTSVSTSVGVTIAKEGLVADVGLARAQSSASATATGIDGGGGNDQIENTGTVGAIAKATANAVAVTVTVEGTKQGVAAGAALTDTRTTASATAVGIKAGSVSDGKDGDHGDHDHKDYGSKHYDDKDGSIANANAITVDAEAKTVSVSASAKVDVAKEGVAIGAALADSRSTSQATAKGIEGNGDANEISNTGTIAVKGDASGTGVSVSFNLEGTATGLAAGAAFVRAAVNATSNAIGIDGGAGDDRLSNDGSITFEKSKSTAVAVGVAPSVVVAKSGAAIGGALADTRATATSTAAALDGGAGDDKLTNHGTITLNHTTADADAVSVSIGVAGAQNGVALSGALVDAHAKADATGIGMAGGEGRDALASTGSVTVDDVHANSDSVGVSVGIGFSENGVAVGAALARSGTEANATGKALDGGAGKDLLYTEGELTVKNVQADATAVSVSVGASGAVNGLAISAGLADASGKATSSATALDGGADDDAILNRAKIDVQDVNANATAVGVSVELAGTSAGVAGGVTLVNSSGTATATAKGIDGGTGDDALWNKGALTMQRINADANSVSAGVSIGVAVTGGVAGGAALSNATATANANATGMDGGSGNDSMGNVASITLNDITSNTDAVGVSVQLGVTTAGVALGAALADTSTTANSTAKGMDGGSGDDFLYNGGSISLNRIKADANAVSVGVTGNLAITGGVAAGAALTDGGGTANVTAIGMDGGSGRDKLVNTGSIKVQDAEADAHATGVSVSAQVSLAGGAGGAALTDTSATAHTVVKGIDGGAGDDTIYNKGTIDVHGKSKADATSVDVTVGVALGVGGGAQMADTSTTAETTAMGIDGGGGRDAIGNEGAITATAEADSQSTSVGIGITVAIGGDATLIDATSTATATATGINDADEGATAKTYSTKHDDRGDHEEAVNEISNTGAVTATATASSKGVSVAGNLLGYALGKTSNTATANATGIRTSDTRDQIKNEGAVTAISSATVSGVSVAVTLGGKAMGDASSTATATATAIDTGAGDDQIENLAALSAGATSQASATGVSVGLIGVSAAKASTTATATATGLNSGSGEDQIANHSTITVSAGRTDVVETGTGCNAAAGGACARASSVSVNLAGSGTMNASTTASARAMGIAAGADDDVVDSDGAIEVSAHAKTGAGRTNVNIAGATSTNVTTTASAQAAGIAGEDGNDVIRSASSITAKASSDIVMNGTGVTIAGAGGFDATLSATARATAIDGGAGKDKIHNEASLSATAAATLNSGGGSNVIFGASGADSDSGAIADAAGIRGGAGDDFIWNEGSITTNSAVSLSLGNSSFTFGGAGGANGTLTATSRSTGIAGDEGHDAILSSSAITVDASSVLDASGGSTVIFGASSGSATSGASTTAIGIDGGAHADGILVDGSLTITARSQLTLSGSSFTFGGASGAGGSLSASTLSIGVAGGTGADAIGNKGDVSASADSNLSASGSSNVAFGASTGGANAGAITDARGIDGGDDDDFLHNKGSVAASATATLTLGGGSFTFGGAGGTQGSLTATTRSTGIAGGAGQDVIKNEGEIHSTNMSTLNSSGGSDVAFGTSGASSSAGAVAVANGIDGGDGDDFVWNAGSIFVKSTANLDLGGSSYTFGGTGDVGGRLNATTSSAGIQGGKGKDFIGNEGSISVDAGSKLTSNASVNTTFGTSASGAVVGSDIGAAGIDGGAGDDVIKNLGTVTAKATASVDSGSSSYVFGGTTSTNIVAQAGANSAGLRGGDGNDFIFNSGDVTADAISTATSAGSSYAEFGGSASRGEMAASLVARGIDGGAGDDVVVNVGTVSATGTSGVSSTHSTDTGFLFGDGDSVASGSTTLSVFGIDTGDGDNVVVNKGAVNVDLFGSASVKTTSDGGDIFDGDAFSRSDSTLTATAIGIRAGSGNDWIENKGSVDIKTWRRFEIPLPGLPPIVLELPTGASANANADGDGIDGDGTIRSFATTNLTAVGIDAGDGNNHVENLGTITIDARAFANATGSVDSDAGGSTSAILEARVNAHAVGIRTGAGDDYVINKGRITVTTDAFNNTGSGHIVASATGIDTGAGNDTIVNQGTISATTIVNGVSSSGTAIRAGAGDDVVKLTGGSVTNGTIDLGTGSNRLVLEGTPVINGTILDGSGSLGLVFDTAGSFAGSLPGVSATKNGPGTFTLSMLNKMRRIEVNQGTLKLDSDYTFMSNGMFQAKVNGDGSYGQFYVNGRAALDGTMKIVRGGGAYVNGTAFDVLTAGNGIQSGTAFSRVELPDDTRLLKFHSEQLSDGVRVKADAASFTTVAGTPNQMAVARNLDRILPRTSGDLNDLLGKIQVMPEGQFASAFASMSPAVYAGYTASTFNTVQQYTNVLQDRMTALRASEFSPARTAGALSGEPVRLAYAGKGLADVLDASEAERARSSGLWLRGFSQKGDQNATEDMNGFDYRLTGTTIGYDHRWTNGLSAGVSFGAVRNTVNVDSNVSQGDIDSKMGSIYAGYFDQRWYLNGALSAGRNKYDTRRTNMVDQSTISSAHNGDVLAAALGVGRYVPLEAWWAEPLATLQFTRLKEEAFSETGNGAMDIPARISDGLVSTLGVRLSRPIQDGNGATWVPQASLAWLHDFSKNQVLNASYAGAPDSSFSIDGQPIQRNGALLGFGVNYRSKGGLTSTFQYTGEFRDQFRAHTLAGEFRFEF